MVRQTLEFLRVGLIPTEEDARALYALLSPDNLPGETSRFINLGYWADAQHQSYDAGAAALADRLAQAAHLTSARQILDVGFGYGDQLLRWLDTASPQALWGLNVSAPQLHHARTLLGGHPLGERAQLMLGSACALPLPDGSVDRVLALESAFHFTPRTTFFAEAHRVLEEDGVLALADILLMPGERLGWPFTSAWRIPKANCIDRVQYAAQLREAGFRDVEVTSIREHVFDPLLDRLAQRLRDPEVVARMHPLLRAVCLPNGYTRRVLRRFDYVIATARR